MSSKFNKELEVLVRDKVISPELADKIEQYYALKQAGKPNKLFAIFGVFGALLIGSGIILLLAHNWDDFSRITKTIIAFIPLLVGQCLTGYTIYKKKNTTWKEASGTFLFFAVGISISLISQIYNIPGDLGPFLAIWIFLCLPLIYLLRSHAVTLLCLVFSTFYALEVGLWSYRDHNTPWLYLLFLAIIVIHYLYLLKNSMDSNATTIFNWLIPLSLTIAVSNFLGHKGEFGLLIYLTLFGVLYNIGKLSNYQGLRTLRNGFLIIGSLGTTVTLLILTFKWVWEELPDHKFFDVQGFYVAFALLVIGVVSLWYASRKMDWKLINMFQISFILIWTMYFVPMPTAISTILINMLVFTLGIVAIRIGAKKFNFGILNYGLLIISVLIVCRFFDTAMSFVIRGILFVIVGIGFFVVNYMMLKKQNQIK